MALIRCPECGRTVSDRAAACPDCAFPIREWLQEQPVVPELPAPEAEPTVQEAEPTVQETEPAVPELPDIPAPPPAAVNLPRRFSLKLLLVIITGSLLLVYSFVLFTMRAKWDVPGLTYRLSPLYLLHGAMLFCVLRKKIPALILASLYVVFLLVATIVQLSAARISLYEMVAAIPSLLLAVLLILFAVFMRKAGNSLVWPIVFAALFVCELVYCFFFCGLRFNLPGLVWYFFYAQYYAIGFSPDNLYRH